VPFLVDTKFMLNNSNSLFSPTNRHTPLEPSFLEAVGSKKFEIEISEKFGNFTVKVDF